MTINFDTLFSRIGKAANGAKDLDTAASTSLVATVRAFEDDLDIEQQNFQQDVLGPLEQSLTDSISTIGGITSAIFANPVSNLITETINADIPLLNKSISVALSELINQMLDNGETVERSTVTTSVSYGDSLSSSIGTGDNIGNAIFAICTKRGDGRVNEFIYSENILCKCNSVSLDGTARWTLTAEPKIDLPNPLWPGGSGATKTVASNVAGRSNLIQNGTFEDEDAYATGLPKYWISVIGIPGATFGLTDIEEQTITINGSPSAGYYTLHFTDRKGRVHTTVPLPYNATATAVQSALNDLPYLGSVEVTQSGTSPLLTHTVQFINVPNPAQLTSTNNITGGTITHATTVEGSIYVVRGDRCLAFQGNDITLNDVQVAVSVKPRTCYACNIWTAVDSVPMTGELTIRLIDGDSGLVIDDDQGVANELTINLASLTATPSPNPVFFHTPLTLPPRVYLSLKATVAVPSGTILYMDELCMVEATEFYPSGFYVASFAGSEDSAVEDQAIITTVNNREGELHSWINRFLGLEQQRLMLPTSASPSQPDSLIT